MKKVAIIGAGAAGMMAMSAILEESHDCQIFLIEKNASAGNKVLLTGGGRCNVTTGLPDMKEVLKRYPRGSVFLKYAMHFYPPKAVCEFFVKRGVRLKTEKDFRVFPVSDRSCDIVGVFEKEIKNPRVKTFFGADVVSVVTVDNGFEINFRSNEKLLVDEILLATGSSPVGYKFAKEFGHKITKLNPSLYAFSVKENFIKNLAGIHFEQVKMKLVCDNEYVFKGPFLFTHKGISGPCVFAISSMSAHEEISKNSMRNLFIDFFPEENYQSLGDRISKEFVKNPRKRISNILSEFVTKSFAGQFLSFLLIDKIAGEISKKELNKIVENLKNLRLTIDGKIKGEEFVTAGGVDLREVDAKTMQSKISPNLYFAGEILDIDAFTGGFNLQSAWCTGRLAGESIVKNL
jgi:hypothetical protein